MNICVVGTYEIGLSTAILLGYLNHFVILVDDNQAKIDLLRNNSLHFFEPYLNDMIKICNDKLYFTTNLTQAIDAADIVFYTTNPGYSNMEVCQIFSESLKKSYKVLVNKSIDYLGVTAEMEKSIIERTSNFSIIFEAPHVRTGSLINDTFFPDKIIIGTKDMLASEKIKTLYHPLLDNSVILPEFISPPHNIKTQLIITDINSAEAAYHIEKVFHAIKGTLFNEISNLAERFDAKSDEILRVLKSSETISNLQLKQGLGWTHREYGKNFEALTNAASKIGMDIPIIKSALAANYSQRDVVFEKISKVLDGLDSKNIGVLGLSFKPFTDDLTDSPAVDIIQRLVCANANIRVHDPVCNFKMGLKFPELPISFCDNVISLFDKADMVILCTDWPEYFELDWFEYGDLMRNKIIFDARNCLSKEDFKHMGFKLLRIGGNDSI